MKTILCILAAALLALWSSRASGQQHSFGGFHGSGPDPVFTGQTLTGAVAYLNADGFNDNHLWTFAEVVWLLPDGPRSSGNLLTKGATVQLYSNRIPAGIEIVGPLGAIMLKTGWAARVSTTIQPRMIDIGRLESRGHVSGLDLNDAIGPPRPLPTDGNVGSAAVVVQGLEMRAAVVEAFGSTNLTLEFVRPQGVGLVIQYKTDPAGPWIQGQAFPASTRANTLCWVSLPRPAGARFYRLAKQ